VEPYRATGSEHSGLKAILGYVPNVYSCYRFTAKLLAFAPLLE
jgi:hypothetical protein